MEEKYIADARGGAFTWREALAAIFTRLAARGTRKIARSEEESAARYRAIVDTAVDAIIVADHKGRIQSFNRAAEKIFGYQSDEVVGENVSMLMTNIHREKHDGYLAHYRSTGERKIIGIGREVCGQRKDGSTVPLELSIAEWRDAKGRQCFTGIMRDVTQRYENERALLDAKEEAERIRIEAEAANRAKSDFLAVMSHEIRTPLTSISGFADLLSATDDLSPEQQRYLDLIRTANSALLTVVNDILDFSKIEAGLMELESKPFAPKALLHDTVAVLRPQAELKGLKIHYSIADDVPAWLMGDSNRLRQILLNLLNNAIKFTPKGSVVMQMELRNEDTGRACFAFNVKDTGVGISEEKQTRLFKRFSQADSSVSRRYGGTGLGLAICKSLVELMNGEIGLNSERGKGSEIWFTACLGKCDRPEATETKQRRTNPARQSAFHILLVDDLDTNREIASAYLARAGFQVTTAENAPKAIRMLQRKSFDLVLMDIQMPDMDGMEATRCIRALKGSSSSVPVIAMTGNVLAQQINACLTAGMNDHVAKPIEPEQLVHTITRWLDHDAPERPASRNKAKYDFAKIEELIDLLGPDKVEEIARQFVRQLDESFKSDPKHARQEAHDLINAAGILGFNDFAELCKQVQWTETDEKTKKLVISVRRSKGLIKRAALNEILPKLHSVAASRASNARPRVH